MDVQLDAAGAGILQRQLERSGLKMLLGKTTERVLGEDRITGLQFSQGAPLACDMVVVAAGIRPNIDLAKQAGLRVNRGIVGRTISRVRTSPASTRSVSARSIEAELYGP